MTKDLIFQSQTGNRDATLKLIKKFNPLLKKYSYKLCYDDAYDDLLIDFIMLLNNVKLEVLRDTSEGTIVSYICKSVRSNYIKRFIALKKLHAFVPFSDLSDSQLYYAETTSSTSDTYFELEFTGVDHVLTELELSVIKMIFLLGYTVSETAYIYGISRQAVNQTKNRALKKLKTWF